MLSSKFNYKVILLSGGKGTRLGKITKTTPKPLIKVNNKEFIHYILDFFQKHGINDFIITTSYKNNLFKKFLKQIKNQFLKIKIINETRPLGTGGSLLNVLKKEKINNKNTRYILCNADTLALYDLTNLENIILKKNKILIVLLKKNCERYGYIKMKENLILDIKRNIKKKGYISTGIFIFKNININLFPKNKFLDFEKDLIPKLIKSNNKIFCHKVNVPFIDIGVKKDLNNSKRFIKKEYNEFIERM